MRLETQRAYSASVVSTMQGCNSKWFFQTLNLPRPSNWASVSVRHVCSLSQPVASISLEQPKVTKITRKEGGREDKMLDDRIAASATQTEKWEGKRCQQPPGFRERSGEKEICWGVDLPLRGLIYLRRKPQAAGTRVTSDSQLSERSTVILTAVSERNTDNKWIFMRHTDERCH